MGRATVSVPEGLVSALRDHSEARGEAGESVGEFPDFGGNFFEFDAFKISSSLHQKDILFPIDLHALGNTSFLEKKRALHLLVMYINHESWQIPTPSLGGKAPAFPAREKD